MPVWENFCRFYLATFRRDSKCVVTVLRNIIADKKIKLKDTVSKDIFCLFLCPFSLKICKNQCVHIKNILLENQNFMLISNRQKKLHKVDAKKLLTEQ
jgi:hypothetical protein